ncbi:hypothetical protein SAMN05216223_103445 [Actinacidiphila yanglinensis]|uniref:SMODS and SLOG-associating 2TM effector domain-containing protein n=1 Tax=Actinacidiphila yanglinensis TaxID=310779 RepID=A0A1H5XW01_9ACTN|nr:SLATT domain-containing protein [Actinacidiphila yanglinensis]SEG15969.1 hypothetical protein SAMN05216223_103445 [Actinacidiphila yanglinensis]
MPVAEHDDQRRERGAAARPRRPRRGDLQMRPFPAVAADTPAAQRRALAELRAWAEQGAEDAIDWYLRDKRSKRTASRLLQGLAIVLAVAGTAIPLGAAATGSRGQGWGYVLLAAAAGCKGFDHFFGLSAGWMRDIAVAHALRFELGAVRLEWAAEVLRAGPAAAPPSPDAPLDPAEVERRLALVDRLVAAVRTHVEGETAAWQAEFSAATRQLNEQGGLPGADRPPGT